METTTVASALIIQFFDVGISFFLFIEEFNTVFLG